MFKNAGLSVVFFSASGTDSSASSSESEDMDDPEQDAEFSSALIMFGVSSDKTTLLMIGYLSTPDKTSPLKSSQYLAVLHSQILHSNIIRLLCCFLFPQAFRFEINSRFLVGISETGEEREGTEY